MEIYKNIRIVELIAQYADIVDVIELFGIQRVVKYSLRALVARAPTVEGAACVHRFLS